MRTLVWLIGAILLATAMPAAAQNCPLDAGAALAAACPCADDGHGKSWKNHGQYVSCVVRFRNDLRKQGCLDDAAKRSIARCAARSTCGKDGAVLCCVYDASGTCNDPTPGDTIAAGTCSNDATHACDTDLDCVTATGPKVSRHEDHCTNKGGTAVGGGSVCSSCPMPTPTPAP